LSVIRSKKICRNAKEDDFAIVIMLP